MGDALGWGALAASSLILGALIGLARTWPDVAVGLVLAFGAGALISAVSFDLAEEGVQLAGATAVGIGLSMGALAYYLADRALPKDDDGAALTLGAFRPTRPVALGVTVGIGAHLLHAAATTSLEPWFLPTWLGTVWLASNATVCLIVGLALAGTEKLDAEKR